MYRVISAIILAPRNEKHFFLNQKRNTMTKITQFTPAICNQLRAEINAILKPIAEKYGLDKIEMGSGRYDAQIFTSKLEFALPVSLSSPVMIEKFTKQSKMLGFTKNIVGASFTQQGRKFVVEKIETGRPKYPIVGKGTDGKMYKFQISASQMVFDDKDIKLEDWVAELYK